MKRAFSYVRFSSKAQAKGESKRRQNEGAAKWAEQNEYFLDTSLTLEDLGISAHKGRNASHGALGAFLDAIDGDNRRIEKGSVLIVESLDRLSRQEVPEALELFLGILRKGVDIVTLSPTPEFFSKKTLDMTQLIIAIVILSRAWEESAMKSVRGKDKWAQRRAKMARGEPIGNLCPKWLEVSEDGKKYVLVKDKAATVKKIFNLYLDGNGTHAIAKLLNDGGFDVLGHGKRWTSGQVRHVLTNRQLIGERQPHEMIDGNKVPIGEPIKGAFPVLIDSDSFMKVQSRLKMKHVGKAGPRGKYVTSLFTNLLVSYLFNSVSEKAELIPWVIHGADGRFTIAGPRQKPEGHKNKHHLPYNELESGILAHLAELDINDLISHGHETQDSLEILRANLDQVNSQLAKMQGLFKRNPDLESLVQPLREMEAERKQLLTQIEDLETIQLDDKAESLKDLQELIQLLGTAEGDELIKLRTRLKSRLRQTIKHIIVRVEERTNQDRTVSLLINFHNFARVRVVQLAMRTMRGGGVDVQTTSAFYDLDSNKWNA